MYKKVFAGLLLFGILTTMLAACAIYDEAGASGPTVHMGNANFLQSTITISKGQSIDVIDDVSVEHILKNGTWNGGTQELKTESGAPTIDVTFNGGDSASIGPFNTAGQFEILCTLHPGMNLTVTVQ
jgi:plastocyanin